MSDASNMSDAFKTKFLMAALPDAPFDGWTEELMERTAQRLRVADGKVVEAFPAGVRDLVAYFSHWATEETLARLKKEDLKSLRVRDRITLGVRIRLEVMTPYKPAVSAALAFMARHPLALSKQVWRAADRLWWAAGDTATDYNHYTKRALLSGVLTSTTLYWLNDTSKGHAQTWAFLDRRIEEVLKVGQKIAQFKKKSGGG